MAKLLSAAEAVSHISNGMSVMFGGFMGCGNAHTLVDALLQQGTANLTLIANDTALPEFGIGKLIVGKRISTVIASHIGLNPVTGQQMNEGSLAVELVPQGTLAERIRAAGAGLGGFLTPTGIGTPVQEGKQVLRVGGKEYLLELPLAADIALIKCRTADSMGNLVYHRSAQNFNPLMAMAAKLVIVEAEELVKPGDIDPDQVHTPGVFVDYLVQGKRG